ncbi:hypothetical protein LCGC14_0553590 [marine sediment metagenome]|uniref:Uncharacterized protein n=1 Tax=marine sediment metagenome TaxID=412755 RepID=A0A0F9RU72_9ZZZZ
MSLERVGIEDGTGNGYKAKVNSNNQLHTRSVLVSGILDAALRGDAYAWNAISADINTTDCMLMVRNLSATKLLVINRIYVWVDVATAIDIHITTDATAFSAGGAGAAVVGVPLNTAFTRAADAGGYSDDIGVVQGTIIKTLHTNELATDQFAIDYQTNDEIVLGQYGCVGVDDVAEGAAFECTIVGYFIDA